MTTTAFQFSYERALLSTSESVAQSTAVKESYSISIADSKAVSAGLEGGVGGLTDLDGGNAFSIYGGTGSPIDGGGA
jgi:hypothetical protein